MGLGGDYCEGISAEFYLDVICSSSMPQQTTSDIYLLQLERKVSVAVPRIPTGTVLMPHPPNTMVAVGRARGGESSM